MPMTNPVGPWRGSDPLGEALHSLRMRGAFYCPSELSEPWGGYLPPMEDVLFFHVVTAGRCWLEVGEGDPVLLERGDLAVVPHGAGHILRSGPDVETPSILDQHHDYVTDQYAFLRYGGGGAPARLICGAVKFDHPAARHLIEALPPVLTVRSTDPLQSDWLGGILRLIGSEAEQARPGGEAVITRLCDVVVIQAIRTWIEHDPAGKSGWLGALQDPQLGRVLALINRSPERPWTVESLAAEAAMSRSAFAARFSELVGESPMQYVSRWRMHAAVDHLSDASGPSVAEVASRLGYQSEAAFSRAFKRVVGASPRSFKRSRDRSPAESAVAG